MIVLDTSVLAYATGSEHPLRSRCQRILAAHRAETIEATTTVEVIEEFAHVRARRSTRADAVALASAYVDAFDLLVTRAADLVRGLELFARLPRLGAFDAVLAAVALERGADALVSADPAFGLVDGLRWVIRRGRSSTPCWPADRRALSPRGRRALGAGGSSRHGATWARPAADRRDRGAS